MRSAFAFIAWLVLLGPAIQGGKVLESNLYPGPVVKVRFQDGTAIDGQMRYRIDGSEWVVDTTGMERKIDPAKMVVIESIPRPEPSEPFAIAKLWLGLLPLILLTLGLWVSAMPRQKIVSVKE